MTNRTHTTETRNFHHCGMHAAMPAPRRKDDHRVYRLMLALAAALGVGCNAYPDSLGRGGRCDDDGICASLVAVEGMADTVDATGGVADGIEQIVEQPGEGSEYSPFHNAPPTGDKNLVEHSDGETCAETQLALAPIVPRVMFVIDASTSMVLNSFGDAASRWDALQGSLLAEEGLIKQFDDRVSFGASFYHSQMTRASLDYSDADYGTTATCPNLATVETAVGNYADLKTRYEAITPRPDFDPGHTPTGEAIESVVAELGAAVAAPDADDVPTLLILATDGEPDTCTDPHAEMVDHKWLSQDDQPARHQTARDLSRAAVENARNMGIETFVISVGEGAVAADHLQQLADAGVDETGAQYWEPSDTEGLGDALRSIVSRSIPCEVPLHGSVDVTKVCEGTVELNGQVLDCEGADGFGILDEQTLVLNGVACDSLKTGEAVDLAVRFPCGIYAPE